MARKPLTVGSTGIDSVATGITANDGKLYKAALLKVKTDGTIESANNHVAIFKINPSSWEENKTSNWVGHSIPGQSDPVYQWISGGPRTVSFEALVTKDTSYFEKKAENPLQGLAQNSINVIGNIASAMSGIDVNALAASTTGFFSSPDPNKALSIEDNLNYYRSLLYPEYTANEVVASPPLLILYAGSTFSSFGPLGQNAIMINKTHHIWILTNLKIQVTKQLPNLSPMEAYVHFQLTQYAIAPFSASQFPTGASLENTTGSPSTVLKQISDFLGF